MSKYVATAAILMVILASYLFSSGPMTSSPQQVDLIAGASVSVGGGRATMWFAQPMEIYADGRIVSGAQVSLKCKGGETAVTILPGQYSEPVCGVRVKLLNLSEPDDRRRVFRAKFEVAW